MSQVLIHVEIPEGGTPMLEVPVALLPEVTDEQDLVLTSGTIPGLPTLLFLVFAPQGEGIPVHVEIPDGSPIALLELPAGLDALDFQDEENLQALPGVPTATLVLLKHVAPA